MVWRSGRDFALLGQAQPVRAAPVVYVLLQEARPGS